MPDAVTESYPPTSPWSRRNAPPAAENRDAPAAESHDPEAGAVAPPWYAVSRAVAVFLGALAVLTAFSELRTPGLDANYGWIDLRPLSPAASRGLLSLCGSLLMAWGLKPQLPLGIRRLGLASTATLLAFSLWNTFVFYRLLRAGALRSECLVPLSLHIGTCLSLVLAALRFDPLRSDRPDRDLPLAAAALTVCLVSFPLAQIFCLGRVDHRQPAQAIVVFVHSSATDGPLPADGIRTACRLFHDGLADTLVIAATSQVASATVEGSKTLAVELGVPAEHVRIAEPGAGTQDAAFKLARLLQEEGRRQFLAVGDDYRLPRLQLCCRRAGLQALTVPTAPRRSLAAAPALVVDEAVALWRCVLLLPDAERFFESGREPSERVTGLDSR